MFEMTELMHTHTMHAEVVDFNDYHIYTMMFERCKQIKCQPADGSIIYPSFVNHLTTIFVIFRQILIFSMSIASADAAAAATV